MVSVLIDTDVLIDVMRNKELLWEMQLRGSAISIITLYEYLFGECYIGKDIKTVKESLEKIFQVIDLDQQIICKAIEIDVYLTKNGEKMSIRDLIIGATAIVYDLMLVTRNVEHFERLKKFGLKIERS